MAQFHTLQRHSRLRLPIAFIGCLILLAALGGSASAAPRPAASCENVAGTSLGQAVPTDVGFDVYVIEITGPLSGHTPGTQLTTVTIEKVTPGGTIHFTGIHVFETTDFGPMTTSDKGQITPQGRGHNVLTIVEGASGSINVHAEVDFETGLIDLWYHGRVCV